ncbi:MAG TPA: hypothetical protein VKT52_09205 [Ktedonobacterales bacterium]|nr:hypothetical protein [Ktedonobacterales bacterium]
MQWDPRLGGHDREEADLKDQEFRNAVGYEHQVGEALQARQASGYKVRWRIAWGQVLGLLILAAVVAGFLLLLFAGGGH